MSPWEVVTIGREYGSGGAAVGSAVAKALGFRLLDRTLIERIAAAANVDPAVAQRLDEHVDGWVARIHRALRFGAFDSVAVDAGEAIVDAARMQALTAAVIQEAAAEGRYVIVGRAAQCVLRGRPAVFNVFVYASRADRARRLRARLGPEVDVETLIDDMDRERAAYVKLHHGCDWVDRRLYHLMVNAALGESAAVKVVLAALEAGVPSVS